MGLFPAWSTVSPVLGLYDRRTMLEGRLLRLFQKIQIQISHLPFRHGLQATGSWQIGWQTVCSGWKVLGMHYLKMLIKDPTVSQEAGAATLSQATARRGCAILPSPGTFLKAQSVSRAGPGHRCFPEQSPESPVSRRSGSAGLSTLEHRIHSQARKSQGHPQSRLLRVGNVDYFR